MQRWLNPNNTETIFIDDKLSRDKIRKLPTLCIGVKLAGWLKLFIYTLLATIDSNFYFLIKSSISTTKKIHNSL